MKPSAAVSDDGDPWLLTPGPLTTSAAVKRAMLHDFGSRDDGFIEVNAAVLARLVELAGGGDAHVAVPLQGSGTFVVEAMLGCFVPADGKVLIGVNGAYGRRMARICEVLGREFVLLDAAEDAPIEPAAVARALDADSALTHVAVVQCETTSGLLNPLAEIAACVAAAKRRLLVDAMSAFGALPLDHRAMPFDAVAASANKCLQGVPGVGFCIARRDALVATAGNAPSLALDLHDQWRAMCGNGQWRFTPPTHAVLALAQALDEHRQEGGVVGRGRRYRRNCRVLVDGMRAMGFATLLPDHLQAPIIVTFVLPADRRFRFDAFYAGLRARGYVIYPGKLTAVESFRIGCIGALGEAQMRGVLAAVREVLDEFGMGDGGWS